LFALWKLAAKTRERFLLNREKDEKSTADMIITKFCLSEMHSEVFSIYTIGCLLCLWVWICIFL